MVSTMPRKRIPIADVRIGMYVVKLDGSWLDHPFWRRSFLLDDRAVLTTLLGSGVAHVWIDTDLGIDVPPVDPVPEAPAVTETPVSDAQAEGADSDELIWTDVAEADPVDSKGQDDSPREVPAIAAPAVVRTSVDPGAVSRLHENARKSPADATDWARARKISDQARVVVGELFDKARGGNRIDTDLARPLVDDVINSVREKPGTLSSLVRLKRQDQYTYMHSVAVCTLMTTLALELGLNDNDVREAATGGLLHDIGKMAVDIDVLNKPGKLTDDEFLNIKRHTTEGHRILVEAGGLGEVPLDICRHHHERLDGKGYPDGLGESQISLFARMGTVCDVYDAITSNRPYKKAWEPAIALSNMAKWVDGAYEIRIFKAFVKALGVYPNGSMVRLESNALAVVIDQSPASSIKPVVKTIWSTRTNQPILPEVVRLDEPGCQDRILKRESVTDWPVGDITHHWITPAG